MENALRQYILLSILTGMVSGCAAPILDAPQRNAENEEREISMSMETSNRENTLDLLAQAPEAGKYIEMRGLSPITMRAISHGVIEPPQKTNEVRVFVAWKETVTVGALLEDQLEKSRGYADGFFKRYMYISLIRDGRQIKGRPGWLKEFVNLEWPLQHQDTIHLEGEAF